MKTVSRPYNIMVVSKGEELLQSERGHSLVLTYVNVLAMPWGFRSKGCPSLSAGNRRYSAFISAWSKMVFITSVTVNIQ